MKIFINPGHKIGEDPGACGYGLQEAVVAMNIAKKLQPLLDNVGYSTKLYSYDGLAEIVDVSNYWDPDIFVSIHCNAANTIARGTETYHYYNSYFGKLLAKCIQDKLVENIPTIDRGVREAGFFVIKYTHCPAVLVETAFIDNYHDNQLLRDFEDTFAKSIAVGITDFFEVHYGI